MSSANVSPGPVVRKYQWIRISDTRSQSGKASFKFLYIGDNEATELHLSSQLQKGDTASDFEEARKKILETSSRLNEDLYDVIFIDLPLDMPELKGFCSFLRKNKLLKIVLIYNGRGLSSTCVMSIRKLGKLDDILDFQSNSINYATSISFLKRSKRAHKLRYLRSLKKRVSWLAIGRCVSCTLKRTLDIIAGITALIIFFPLFLVIALIIKLESRGPVFYTSPRAGKGYRIFKFHKFRTMRQGADQEIGQLSHLNQYADSGKQAVFYKIQNDPRVTRFGRFLRNTSLDEIPQFINVLRGDMSLVGNRPLPLYEAAALTTNECVERFSATAGITGLWQVKKRGKAEMSDLERISLDITYARKENLFYDFWIMLCTPVALMQKSDV